MSKILSPKAWYLVAIGAAALMADGARRLIKSAGKRPSPLWPQTRPRQSP